MSDKQLSKIRYKYIVRGICLLLICTFTFSSTVTPLTVIPENLSTPHFAQSASLSDIPVSHFEIPEQFGHVELVAPAKSAVGTSPVVIHIRDAHGSYEAQINTMEIIDYLTRTYGVKNLYLEAASSKLNPNQFELFQDQSLNERIGDYLVKQGDMSGAELFLLKHIHSESIRATGIEDLSSFAKNLKTFQRVASERSAADEFLKFARAQIEVLGSKYFNKDLREFLRSWLAWRDERLNMLGFLSIIKRSAINYLQMDLSHPKSQVEYPMLVRFFKAQALESKVNPTDASVERDRLVAVLATQNASEEIRSGLVDWKISEGVSGFKAGLPRLFLEKVYTELGPEQFKFEDYPELTKVFAILILQSEIDGSLFFGEIEKAVDGIFKALMESNDEKALVSLIERSILLEKLLKLELIRNEVGLAMFQKDELSPVSFIENLMQWREVDAKIYPLTISLESTFESAIDFYQGALAREKFLVENTKRLMKEDGQRAGIVVTGGFHSDGLQERFKKENFSYIEISPRLSSVDGVEKVYLESMLGTRKTIFDHSQIRYALAMMSQDELDQLNRLLFDNDLAGKAAAESRRAITVLDGIFSQVTEVSQLTDDRADMHVAQIDGQDYLIVAARYQFPIVDGKVLLNPKKVAAQRAGLRRLNQIASILNQDNQASELAQIAKEAQDTIAEQTEQMERVAAKSELRSRRGIDQMRTDVRSLIRQISDAAGKTPDEVQLILDDIKSAANEMGGWINLSKARREAARENYLALLNIDIADVQLDYTNKREMNRKLAEPALRAIEYAAGPLVGMLGSQNARDVEFATQLLTDVSVRSRAHLLAIFLPVRIALGSSGISISKRENIIKLLIDMDEHRKSNTLMRFIETEIHHIQDQINNLTADIEKTEASGVEGKLVKDKTFLAAYKESLVEIAKRINDARVEHGNKLPYELRSELRHEAVDYLYQIVHVLNQADHAHTEDHAKEIARAIDMMDIEGNRLNTLSLNFNELLAFASSVDRKLLSQEKLARAIAAVNQDLVALHVPARLEIDRERGDLQFKVNESIDPADQMSETSVRSADASGAVQETAALLRSELRVGAVEPLIFGAGVAVGVVLSQIPTYFRRHKQKQNSEKTSTESLNEDTKKLMLQYLNSGDLRLNITMADVTSWIAVNNNVGDIEQLKAFLAKLQPNQRIIVYTSKLEFSKEIAETLAKQGAPMEKALKQFTDLQGNVYVFTAATKITFPDVPEYRAWVKTLINTTQFSEVWTLENKSTGEIRVAKLIHAPRDRYPQALQKILIEREGGFLKQLSESEGSRYFPEFLGSYDTDRGTVLVMSHVGEKTKKGDLNAERTVIKVSNLLAGLAKAIFYMHEKHIAHRDLYPANISVAENGEIRVFDFTISNIFNVESGTNKITILPDPSISSLPESDDKERADKAKMETVFSELVTESGIMAHKETIAKFVAWKLAHVNKERNAKELVAMANNVQVRRGPQSDLLAWALLTDMVLTVRKYKRNSEASRIPLRALQELNGLFDINSLDQDAYTKLRDVTLLIYRGEISTASQLLEQLSDKGFDIGELAQKAKGQDARSELRVIQPVPTTQPVADRRPDQHPFAPRKSQAVVKVDGQPQEDTVEISDAARELAANDVEERSELRIAAVLTVSRKAAENVFPVSHVTNPAFYSLQIAPILDAIPADDLTENVQVQITEAGKAVANRILTAFRQILGPQELRQLPRVTLADGNWLRLVLDNLGNLLGSDLKIAVAVPDAERKSAIKSKIDQVLRNIRKVDSVKGAELGGQISTAIEISSRNFTNLANSKAILHAAALAESEEQLVGLENIFVAFANWDGVKNKDTIRELTIPILTAAGQLAQALDNKSPEEQARLVAQLNDLGFAFKKAAGRTVVTILLDRIEALYIEEQGRIAVSKSA